MNVRIILVEPECEGNIGSVARAMKNFGLNELFLVNPKTNLSFKARAYSAHASEIVEEAVIINSLDGALEGVNCVVGTTAISGKRKANIRRTSISPEEFAKRVVSTKDKTALLFGRESRGLSNIELDRCDVVVTIPASRAYKVLNIAAASTIIFYELFRADRKPSRGYVDEACGEEKKRLANLFSQLSVESGISQFRNEMSLRAFKNIIARAFVSKREASLIIGVLRRALMAIKSHKE